MLTKRTNILFDQRLWNQIVELAKEQKSSVGSLIRQATIAHYKLDSDLKRINDACRQIESVRTVTKGRTDYKALINHGRKY